MALNDNQSLLEQVQYLLGPKTHSGATPVGNVVPDTIGQIWVNNTGGNPWFATGLTNADWSEVQGGVISALGDGTGAVSMNGTTYTIGDGAGANLPALDSTSTDTILTVDANGTMGRISRDGAKGIIQGAGAPGNGTTTAHFLGQLYYDRTNNALYEATAASTAPDTAATGSTWEVAFTGSDNLGDGLTATSDVTSFVVGIRDGDATQDGLVALTADDAFAGAFAEANSGHIAVYGKDHAGTPGAVVIGNANGSTGDVTLMTAAGTRGIISLTDTGSYGINGTGANSHTANIAADPNGTQILSLSVSDGTDTAAITVNSTSGIIGLNTAYAGGEVAFGNGSGTNLPTVDSDLVGTVLGITTANGYTRQISIASLGSLAGAGAPVDGTTVAWRVGQLYTDTTNEVLYRVTTASTNPDSAGTGSVFAKVTQTQVIEQLTATADDTLPALANTPIAGTVSINWNTAVYEQGVPTPAFSVAGTAITWDSANSLVLTNGANVTVRYMI